MLSVNGAGFVRFLYGAAAALLIYIGGLILTGTAPLHPNTLFLVYSAAGGLFQLLATNLLIMSFGYRNFAVGTAYSKTEVAQSAVIALVILHEVLKPLAWAGIGFGLCGVLTLSLGGRSLKGREILAATFQPAALCGLGAGLLFAFATVFIKLANKALPDPDIVIK